MDTVREVLNRDEQSRTEAAESIKVDKLIPLECYPKDLLVIDTNEINLPKFRYDNIVISWIVRRQRFLFVFFQRERRRACTEPGQRLRAAPGEHDIRLPERNQRRESFRDTNRSGVRSTA